MKSSCHSEYGDLQSVFIKPAWAAFCNSAKIDREWKALNFLDRPNLEKALNEYEQFESLLKSKGAVLHSFDMDETVSLDSIYCRDASIATDFGMIICSMGKAARKAEPDAQKLAFEKAGLSILGVIEEPGTLEGGDVAWLDERTLAVGHTYRTNESGIHQLKRLLEPHGIAVVVVPLPHYKGPSDVFHLMSVFSPVDEKRAVVYSPLIPIVFREELLRRGYQLIEVPDAEFERMGCNVLALGPGICLMVSGNPLTKAELIKAGCEVMEYSGLEISVKGGGGPTCLTRPLRRLIG